MILYSYIVYSNSNTYLIMYFPKNIFGFCRDNSERTFYKELTKVIEASDVILEVLDARDPLGTRCPDLEKMVLKAGPEKHLVLLLNKIGNLIERARLVSGYVLG
ncbi:putative P-loop containing nucleoside triphosphate hydrolase [Helianthus annuus]|nr:putative P-loop containing nucleoside triphosphate hydrolase [Helianthus annuus]